MNVYNISLDKPFKVETKIYSNNKFSYFNSLIDFNIILNKIEDTNLQNKKQTIINKDQVPKNCINLNRFIQHNKYNKNNNLICNKHLNKANFSIIDKGNIIKKILKVF